MRWSRQRSSSGSAPATSPTFARSCEIADSPSPCSRPDPAAAGKLAKRYRNPSLGEIRVVQRAGKTTFDFGEFKSEVANRTNPDATLTFTTIEPGVDGIDFVVGEAGGKPTLTTRDGQHEYVFAAQ